MYGVIYSLLSLLMNKNRETRVSGFFSYGILKGKTVKCFMGYAEVKICGPV